MRKPFLKVALIPAVVLLVFASGCNLVESPSGTSPNFKKPGIVLKEEFCVTFDEYRTECDFTDDATEAIAAQIFFWLDENGVALGDICQLWQSGGRLRLAEPYVGHEWEITAKVEVKRLDIYDEYTTYLKPQTVKIPKKLDNKGKGYKPKFYHRGVRKINRALEDMVDGQYPQLSFVMTSTDCDPEPSPSDPLIFSWAACIEVTVIVAGYDDDDDDNDCPKYKSSKVKP
jgi:hypothetical protein